MGNPIYVGEPATMGHVRNPDRCIRHEKNPYVGSSRDPVAPTDAELFQFEVLLLRRGGRSKGRGSEEAVGGTG
jgi:hypothetical protein